MKCLVTGVAGFIGSTLAERLVGEGWEVIGVDNFLEYYPRSVKEQNLTNLKSSKGFTFVEMDLASGDLGVVFKDVEVVFHQAGQAGVRASWGEYFKTYTDNNIVVTQRLLEECKKSSSFARFVYASSSSVYGNAEAYPTKETFLPNPVSPYGVTKLAAEHLCGLYCSQFGVPTISLRYFTVFGPRQRPDMAFHKFIKGVLRGEGVRIFGDGEQSRDFTFVEDIVSANILAASKGTLGGVYNIGGGANSSVNMVLEVLRKELGDFSVQYEESQKGEARKTSADTSRAKTELDYSPKFSLEDGLAREIEWMKSFS